MELSIKNLTKKYKDKIAVEDVNLNITHGVWGLLGANGAGKTTLMRMIAGILKPTSGYVQYNGIDIYVLGENYRNIFGYLPQNFGFYPEFTVIDYLEYISCMKGLNKHETKIKINQLLNMVGLEDVSKKAIRKLSGGMQRRVGIAQALINEPEILILDEPTSGLDPGERVYFRNILSEFAQNRIVLISTHIVSDVDYTASKNVIMKNGKIISIGKTKNLISEIENMVFEAVLTTKNFVDFEHKICIANIRNIDSENICLRYIAKDAIVPNSRNTEPNLEDLYLWIFRDSTSERSSIK